MSNNQLKLYYKLLDELEFALGLGPRNEYLKSTYKYISDKIFDKTEVRLSTDTLKRIFNSKIEVQYYPQVETRNAIAKFLGFQDWNDYYSTYNLSQNETLEVEDKLKPRINNQKVQLLILISIVIISLLIYSTLMYLYSKKNQTNSDKKWKTNKELINNYHVYNGLLKFKFSNRIGTAPHILETNYELEPFQDLEYYMSFSKERHRLEAGEYKFTTLYPVPGIYEIKVFRGEWNIHDDWVFVMSKDWLGKVEYYKNTQLLNAFETNSKFEVLSKNALSFSRKWLDSLKKVYPASDNVKYKIEKCTNFGYICDSAMIFESKIIASRNYINKKDRYFFIHLFGDHNAFELSLSDSTFKHKSELHIGDIRLYGIKDDVSFITKHFSDSIYIKATFKHNICTLLINNEQVFSQTYKYHIGTILGMRFESNYPMKIENIKLNCNEIL